MAVSDPSPILEIPYFKAVRGVAPPLCCGLLSMQHVKHCGLSSVQVVNSDVRGAFCGVAWYTTDDWVSTSIAGLK